MSSHSNPLPATIGRFRVDALLGAGGMGEVYRAFDSTLQRTVAVKIVRPDIDRPEYLDRLYREAQACARLQHPNIVTVYEAGELDGVVYIAMEFLKGEDLAAVLRRGQLSFEAKIGILMHVLDALQHAHANDVIHRDIKPSNVHRQSDGSIKLVDFGLARVIEAQTLTLTGTVMGTPHYASPEQLKGLQVDQRTDIYSTGVLAYEMFTGRRPFASDNDSVAAIVLKVISEPAPPMDVSWTRTFPEIERIVSRAMAKSPDDRYQSAEDMRNALAAFLAASRDAIVSAQVQANLTAQAMLIEARNLLAARRPAEARTLLAEILRLSPDASDVRQVLDEMSTIGAWSADEKAPPVERREPTPHPAPARRSRSLWWTGAAATAILIAGVAILPQMLGSTTATPGVVEPPRQADQTAGSAAPPVAQAPPLGGPAANDAPAIARGPGPAAVTGVSTATNTSGPAVRPADSPQATASDPPTRALSAKQLFFGDGNARGSGTSAASQGGSLAQAPNAGLRYRLIRQSPDGAESDVDPTTAFGSADKLRFAFESNIDGYLYVAQLGTSGTWSVLFPNPEMNGGRNVIKGFDEYLVPNNGWFRLDGPPGIEHVFVFLSREPLAGLPGFIRPVTQPENLKASEVAELQGRVRSRDLVFQKDQSNRPGGKPGMVTYVVNRDEVGKAVTTSIDLKHGQ